MIRLSESNSEFLLYVPFQQKDRAKGIDGRRWDTDRRCWAFPKTARVFDAIVGEFGDDLGTIMVTRPDTAPKKPMPEPESENVTLREELTELKKLIQLLTSKEGTQVEKMRQALVLKSQEIEQTKEELYLVSRKLEHAVQEARTFREKNESLRAQLTTSKPKSKIDELVQALLAIAGDASGNSRQFLALIKRIRNPERFPIEFAIAIEEVLRERLRIGKDQTNLHELISQATEAEMLSRDGVDLAHTIRKQRNLFAHSKADHQTGPARQFLTLFAAALLWREF